MGKEGALMVKCSKCGAEHQLEGAYCSNCSAPVVKSSASPRRRSKAPGWCYRRHRGGSAAHRGGGGHRAVRRGRGMSGSQGLGYGLLVVGIIVLFASVAHFGWMRK